MPEYFEHQVRTLWETKGSAQSSRRSFTLIDPDSGRRYLVTCELEQIG